MENKEKTIETHPSADTAPRPAKKKSDLFRLAGTAILAALVIIFQLYIVIALGPFTITLSLIPIVLGGVMFGPISGAILGGVFGAVVTFQVVNGTAGALSTAFLTANPAATVAMCLIKGIAAGAVAGLIAAALSKKRRTGVGVVLACVAAPVVNTGLFILGTLIFFKPILLQYANGLSLGTFIITGFVGLNFVIELGVDLLLIPVINVIVRAVRRSVLKNR